MSKPIMLTPEIVERLVIVLRELNDAIEAIGNDDGGEQPPWYSAKKELASLVEAIEAEQNIVPLAFGLKTKELL